MSHPKDYFQIIADVVIPAFLPFCKEESIHFRFQINTK